jgi:hypothetical protein
MASSSRRVETPHRFDEFALVRLRSVVGTEAGVLLPETVGTIVYRHEGGDTYEVEFADPFPAVVTLRTGDLSLAA